MRIAVPLQQGRFSQHFGGAETFAFYTVDAASRSIADRQLDAPPEHGRGIFPTWLRRKGATVVLAGGMGPRAIDIFAQHGIEAKGAIIGFGDVHTKSHVYRAVIEGLGFALFEGMETIEKKTKKKVKKEIPEKKATEKKAAEKKAAEKKQASLWIIFIRRPMPS